MTQIDQTEQISAQSTPNDTEEQTQLIEHIDETADSQPELTSDNQSDGMSESEKVEPTQTYDDPQIREETFPVIDSDRIFEEDLAAIKAKYPFVTQSHVSQLGEDFIKMMAQGNADAVKAFELTHTDDIVEHRIRE